MATPSGHRAGRTWARLGAVPVVLILVSAALIVTWWRPWHPRTASTGSGGTAGECPAAPLAEPEFRLPGSLATDSRVALSRAACRTVELGETAQLGRHPDSMMEATALWAVRPDEHPATPPVPPGMQRKWFRLQFRNTGTADFHLPYVWVWAASPEEGWNAGVDLPIAAGTVHPGDVGEQLTAFDVTDGTRLTRLRLGRDGTADWVIA
ncbi:hypothetical protein [Actinoplanes sp. CA-252034]|uniref:hypothetical protein n=1 Tax=Actinoplanes sp. CA-252034 TaxID=3239906 RepID=UPI003D96DC6C